MIPLPCSVRSFRIRRNEWITPEPENYAKGTRIIALLNHTSLYEPLFVGGFPNEFIRRIAFKGLMPVADKATRRPSNSGM